MRRISRWKLALSSVIILLPVFWGLLMWGRLPEQMATHWGADGAADGWSGRAFTVFALPLSMLLLHWFCIWVTARDPGNKKQDKKVTGMILWLCPFFSLFSSGIIYSAAFGRMLEVELISILPIGLMFAVIGNYLPKCRQNYTIGIKVKWTLMDEENWNATHRIGGKVWVAGGLLLMGCVFLPLRLLPWATSLLILLMILIPIIYSWRYSRRQAKEGRVPRKAETLIRKNEKRILWGAGIFTVVLLIFAAVICFTGDLKIQYGESSFTIRASYWSDLTVDYAAIDSVEYRENIETGVRTSGFGSPRLSMGNFRNEEFGPYTRYTYTGCDACVVLRADGKTLVIGGEDENGTKAIYEEILDVWGNLSQYR